MGEHFGMVHAHRVWDTPAITSSHGAGSDGPVVSTEFPTMYHSHHSRTGPTAALWRTLNQATGLALACTLVACRATEELGKGIEHVSGGIADSAPGTR